MYYAADYKKALIAGLVVLGLTSCESSWEEAYANNLNRTIQLGFDCLAQKFKLDKYRSNTGRTYTLGFDYDGDYTPDKVEWDFGDGQVQTTHALEVTHTFDTAGAYIVKAQVHLLFREGGCRANKTFNIKVK